MHTKIYCKHIYFKHVIIIDNSQTYVIALYTVLSILPPNPYHSAMARSLKRYIFAASLRGGGGCTETLLKKVKATLKP